MLQITPTKVDAPSKVAVLNLPAYLASGQAVAEFNRLLVNTFGSGYTNLILDCSQVEFVDGSGLQSLIAALRRARQVGGTVVLCAATNSIKMLLSFSNTQNLLPVTEDLRSAFNYLTQKFTQEPKPNLLLEDF